MTDGLRPSPPIGLPLLLALGLAAGALGVGALAADRADSGEIAGQPWAGSADRRHDLEPPPLTSWPAEVSRIRFGVTPWLDEEGAQSELGPVMEHLAERIGVPFELQVAESYAALGAMMQAQELDAAKFSPLSYVEAKEADPGLRIILTQVASGATSYMGYIYTRSDGPAERLEDLANRSFCYVDEHSTSGYLYPRALMRARGLDPNTLFSSIEFGKNHIECVRRVVAGEVEAGAAFSGVFRTAREDDIDVSRLKIIAKTARIPYDAYCVRSGLPRAAAQRIKEELLGLSMRSPEGQRVLMQGTGELNAWTVAQDSDYDSVRQALALVRQADQPAGED